MMTKKLNKYGLILLFICVFNQLSAQMNHYKYYNKILQPNVNWNLILLHYQVSGLLKDDFSDIRIYGINKERDTFEIPYIIDDILNQNDALQIPVKLINPTEFANNQQSIVIELAQLLSLSQAQLIIKELNYDALVTISGSQDLNQWEVLASDQRIVAINNQSTQFSFTNVIFPTSKYKYYKFNIKNSVPLTITDVSILNTATVPETVDLLSFTSFKTSIDKTQQTSNFEFKLQQPVYVNNIQFYFKKNLDFARSIEIFEVIDSVKTEKGWVKNERLLTKSSVTSFANNKIALNNQKVRHFRVEVINADNPALTLDSIQIAAKVFNLYTKIGDANNDYFLAYGNDKANTPNYDLINFKDQIPKDLSPLLMEARIQNNVINESNPEASNKDSFLNNPKILWTLMVVIILILGYFSYTMISKKKD